MATKIGIAGLVHVWSLQRGIDGDHLNGIRLEIPGHYSVTADLQDAELLAAFIQTAIGRNGIARILEVLARIESKLPKKFDQVLFDSWYNRQFSNRTADTQHLDDCERAYRAGVHQ